MARVQDQVIVMKDVPAWACERCGEAEFPMNLQEDRYRDARSSCGTICVRPLAAGEIELPV